MNKIAGRFTRYLLIVRRLLLAFALFLPVAVGLLWMADKLGCPGEGFDSLSVSCFLFAVVALVIGYLICRKTLVTLWDTNPPDESRVKNSEDSPG